MAPSDALQQALEEVLARHCRTTAERCSACGQGWPCDASMLVEVVEQVAQAREPSAITRRLLAERGLPGYVATREALVRD